jgi:hypothetical protein
VDAVKENDKVCFTTWDDGYLEEGDWAYYVSSCVVFGRAKLIEDARLTEEKIRAFALKYYPSAEEVEDTMTKYIQAAQLMAIEIEHMSGKRVHEK